MIGSHAVQSASELNGPTYQVKAQKHLSKVKSFLLIKKYRIKRSLIPLFFKICSSKLLLMKNLLQLKITRTSTKFLLHSLQTYKCLHNYASCCFGSLHFKKKALSSDCYLNRFVCVLSDFYCLWLFLNARIPDDFKWNSVSRRETGLCSRT